MFTPTLRHSELNVYEDDATEKLCWQSTPGLWVLDDDLPHLVLVCGENGEDEDDKEKLAVLLEDVGNTPAFSVVDLNARAPAEFIGPAKLKVEAGAAVDDSPLGRVTIVDGAPTMTVLSYGNIYRLSLPPDLLEKEDYDEDEECEDEDADYGTNWSLLLQFADHRYATVLEAKRHPSWLKGWRPLPHSDGDIKSVQEGR